MKIELTSEIDRVDGNWSEWECKYSPDGTAWLDGSIQSDGILHAIETLRDGDGKAVLTPRKP